VIGLNEETVPPSVPVRPTSGAPELAGLIFRPDGWLQAGLGLEHRPEQERMAQVVAAALRDDAPLLFEAGTGVGKSLAYLAPGLVHAVDCGRQMILSTHTIALQEQIERKDLPLCRRLFESRPELARYARFEAAVLVGKSNYLCTSRLSHALADRSTLLADAEYSELRRISEWAETTATGLRHELQPAPLPELWDAVNADSAACSRKHCDCQRCFYQRARARLRTAQLVIVNHALLFSLLAAGGARAEGAGADASGVLFPADFVVLDEAHTVPSVAEAHFGLSLGSSGVNRLLRHLYNPKTRRGLLVKLGGGEACQCVEDCLEGARHFFEGIASHQLASQPVVRIREAASIDPILDEPLSTLQRAVAKIADRLEDGRMRDELLDQRTRLAGLKSGLNEWLTLGDEGHVYWAERGGRRQTTVSLRSAPIQVAPELRRRLFESGVAVVCTSATLAIGGDMAPFAARLGAAEARSEIVRSPFDFERVMRVYVAADIPPPSFADPGPSLESMAEYVGYCCARVPGGSLVLFTSYRDLKATVAAVEPGLARAGRPVLVQGPDVSRTELARHMRELGNAILFGTESFWTGIDVPGDALSQVIITRLPFDPPADPITEAKAEWIRAEGGDPFRELMLPDALVKFRQGAGRLIRTREDRGLITLLDSRLLTKTYGRLFLAGLPQTGFQRLTRENRDAQFSPFVPRSSR